MGYGNYREPVFGEDVLRLGAGERRELRFVVLPGESREIRLDVDLVGEGAELDVKGMFLCSSEEAVRFALRVHHRAPGCRSRQLFKGIAGGSSRVVFDGTILVAPDAQQTEAYQENHNLLLSEKAVVETRPQLEIYADDVKCSHGATVGQLNPLERFYMQSRGIPDAEARVLQMLSFLSPVMGDLSEGERSRVEAALRAL